MEDPIYGREHGGNLGIIKEIIGIAGNHAPRVRLLYLARHGDLGSRSIGIAAVFTWLLRLRSILTTVDGRNGSFPT